MKYADYSKQTVTGRINRLLLDNEYMTPYDFDESYIPEVLHEGQWTNLRTNKPQNLPTGTLVIDVETSDATRSLALGSAYHLESQEIFYWVNKPDNPEALLDVPDDCLVIAHRAAFENSFIRQNYSASRPRYRSFCTYAYAATRLHPLKPGLYRAMNYLPMFGESSDCSLADLYFQATNRYLDKSDVRSFIESQGNEWRMFDWEICMSRGIYEAYTAGKKFKSRFVIPEYLQKFQSWKYPSCPRKTVDRQAKLDEILNLNEQASHEDNLMRHKLERSLKLENPFTYERPLFTKEEYAEKLKKHFNQKTDPIKRGLLYNVRDILATVSALPIVLKQIHDISDEAFTGIQVRLQPMYAVDPLFTNQVETIEKVWTEAKERLQDMAEKNVRTHAIIGGEWDGQDWEVLNNGRVKWCEDKKIGYTKVLNAIASQIHYQGLPLKRVLAHPPVQLKDGTWCFPHTGLVASDLLNPVELDMETRKKYWAYETDPDLHRSYEERMTRMDEWSCTPFENPESTDTKKFVSVTNFFSKALLKYWKNGDFTCESPEMKNALPLYISTSYWTSIRKRMLAQKIIQFRVMFTAPRPSVHGAVSGRSVDSLFLVLAKLDAFKIGSELCGMFVAPPGYVMFTWDLDSCQARVAATVSDAWMAKRLGHDTVTIGSTGISQAVFFGSKENRTSLAHVLGDTYLGFDLSDPVMAAKSYALGKNAQFALVFGVGAEKLAKMLNTSFELADKLVRGWKGVRDTLNPTQWINGTASDLINAQQALATRFFPSDYTASIWDKHEDVLGVVSKEKLPHVLNPRNSGKDFITTKYNAFIQNGDVAMLNHALSWIDDKASHLDYRYCSSIHDYFAFFVREDQVEEFRAIAREGHRACYERFFTLWNVNFSSVPDNVWYPSAMDVGKRLVKEIKDELTANSKTISFQGYSENLWEDISLDIEEIIDLDEDED